MVNIERKHLDETCPRLGKGAKLVLPAMDVGIACDQKGAPVKRDLSPFA